MSINNSYLYVSNENYMKLSCQKHLFSLGEDVHYLNCAYKAPLLKSSEAAAIEDLAAQRTPYNISPEGFFRRAEEVRQLFSELVQSSPSNIVITPSTSYAFSSVLNNTKGKQNGNAVTLQNEFPSGYFSLQRWCRENDQTLKAIGPKEGAESVGESWNQNVLDAINQQTAVVLISTIHWMNGTVMDLEAIGNKCKEVGAALLVDGTQSVGVMDMDVQKYQIDMLVCATYKWLFGPYSVALAHIGDAFSGGKPLEESWMNRTNALNFSSLTDYEQQYTTGAGRYNVGQTSNFVLMPMLANSLKQILAWQPSQIAAYCDELVQPLKAYLAAEGVQFDRPDYASSHLFSLKLPEAFDTEALKQHLANRKIVVSLRGADIRVSLNVFNDAQDIAQLIDAIKRSKR